MVSLSREANQALKILKQNLNEWDGATVSNIVELQEWHLVTDYTAFSFQKITLSRGSNWRWNRTAYYAQVELAAGIFVAISKMNSRSKVARGEAPNYKVWLFTISRPGENALYFMWCERGRDSPITVENYAFLRPFVSDAVAKELNWA